MDDIINNVVAQWWVFGVLIIWMFTIITVWYKYVLGREKEHKTERDEMINMHRKERSERQDRDDQRLTVYQGLANMQASASHWLEKAIVEMRTFMQSKIR